jgi:hypothetical protein
MARGIVLAGRSLSAIGYDFTTLRLYDLRLYVVRGRLEVVRGRKEVVKKS